MQPVDGLVVLRYLVPLSPSVEVVETEKAADLYSRFNGFGIVLLS